MNGLLPAEIALGDGATLGGNGTIAGFAAASGSTVAPGNSIGTLHVAGSLAFGTGSTYQVELGTPGTSDLIAAGGQALLGGNVQALLGSGFQPILGASYTILTAQGGITASFESDTATSSDFGSLDAAFPFLSPDLSYSANAVTLTLDRSAIPFAAAGITPNETATGFGADGLALASPLAGALAALDLGSAAAALDSLPARSMPRPSPCCSNNRPICAMPPMPGCARPSAVAHRMQHRRSSRPRRCPEIPARA